MTKTLTLRPGGLRVDPFDTTPVQRERGTVGGEQRCTCPTVCSCPARDNTRQGDSCAGESIYGWCAQTCANCPYEQPCTFGKPIECWR